MLNAVNEMKAKVFQFKCLKSTQPKPNQLVINYFPLLRVENFLNIYTYDNYDDCSVTNSLDTKPAQNLHLFISHSIYQPNHTLIINVVLFGTP